MMRSARVQAAVVLAVLFTFAVFNQTPAQNRRAAAAAVPDVRYTVSMSKPYTHLLEVEMRLRVATRLPAKTDIIMPVWTPGSYLIREYARHVQDFAVKDAAGRELAWSKTNKNTWRIETGGTGEIVVTYNVYANELTVRTNELNDEHAFWTNAALLMYPAGQLDAPSTVRVQPYDGWKVATGLPPVAGEANTFRAPNFDVLYDSPFEVGDFKLLTFEVKGVPHRIVLEGEGNYDAPRLVADIKKIVEVQVEMMGGEIPYTDYTFMFNLRSTGSGGLEHLNSTALIVNRNGFQNAASYQNILSLVAHEFYHLWNVKRIRPDALGPFDYTQENYTKLLWVAEGITSYYENIFLHRAGFLTDRQMLASWASSIEDLQARPGRFQTSLEEASADAWIKYYRTDENYANNQISYYDKGLVVGMLLDLEIRKRSGGARSLDDVMRYLYTEFAKKNRNYTPADFQRAAEMAAGSSLETFFARYVRGRAELDYNEALSAFGLKLETTDRSAASAMERAYFGAIMAQAGDRLMVRSVRAGTPAYDQGINAGDQLVALDGQRITLDTFEARVAEKKPGDEIRLTVFRNDDLRDFQITLGGRVPPSYSITPVAQPTEEQKRLSRGWLGAS